MKTVKSLLFVWKNPENNLYYHIGTLNYDGEQYTFQYTYRIDSSKTVKKAIKDGYRLHPAFPELEKTYKSSFLFPAFDRRIPDSTRIGYNKILKELRLPSNADRMDILKETRGALAGDPYSFEEPLRINGTKLSCHFYINGMRHQELPSDWSALMSEGDHLKLKMDMENPVDQYAVQILSQENLLLGYVPGIYARAVHALLQQGENISLQIIDKKPNHAPQWWVQVKLEANLKLKEVITEDHIIFPVTA
jgi:hypothetical protein